MSDTMSDRIEKTIELAAPIARVWRALTDHEEFGTWFRVKLETPFAAGATARGRITHPGYEHLAWHVHVTAMEAPRYFAFTWHPYAVDPKVDYTTEPPTLVEFRLAEIPSGTRLTVTESGFSKIPLHRQAGAFRMHNEGWSIQVQNIKARVVG